jgi:hypothetical protein
MTARTHLQQTLSFEGTYSLVREEISRSLTIYRQVLPSFLLFPTNYRPALLFKGPYYLKGGGRAGPYDSLPPNELRFAGVPPTILWRRPPTDNWLEPPGP